MPFPTPFEDWLYRKKITIPAAKIGADLTDFPVTVDLDDTDVQSKIKAFGEDVRFGDLANTSLTYELHSNGRRLSTDGVHTWFNYPVAIYDPEGSGHLYWGTKGIGRDEFGRAYHWDLSDHSKTSAALDHSGVGLSGDDHDNTVVIFRSDGRLIEFTPRHNAGDTTLEYRISTNPRDTSSWGAVKTIGTFSGGPNQSYVQAVRLSAENGGQAIYVWSRNSTTDWVWTKSTDDGETFAAIAPFWVPGAGHGTPYMMPADNGVDRIDFILSTNHGNDGNQHVYGIYYDGSWRNTDGSLINGGAIPVAGFAEVDFNASSTVRDVSSTSDGLWIAGVGYNSLGNTCAILTEYTGNADPAIKAASVKYVWAESSTSWSTEDITTGAQLEITNNPFYPGGGCVDFNVPKGALLSIGNESAGEMQLWANSGGGWAKTLDLTSGTDGPQFRPFPVAHHPGGAVGGQFVWCAGGTYDDFEVAGAEVNTALYTYPAIDAQVRTATVKVPTVTAAADTEFYLYYGNAAAADAQDPANVYAGGLLIVDVGDGVLKDGREINDRGNALDFVFAGYIENTNGVMSPTTFLPSIGTNAVQDTNARIEGPAVDMSGLSGLTIEAIAAYDSTGSPEHTIVSNFGSGTGSALLRIEPADDSVETFFVTNNGTLSGSSAAAAVPANTETYIASVMDGDGGANATAYVQTNNNARAVVGTLTGTRSLHGTPATDPVRMFRWPEADYFKGSLALLRIWNSAKSQQWCDATYLNFYDAAFYAFSAEEPSPSGAAVPRTMMNQNLGASLFNGTLQ